MSRTGTSTAMAREMSTLFSGAPLEQQMYLLRTARALCAVSVNPHPKPRTKSQPRAQLRLVSG
jgi:hypothetical protein